MVVLGLATSWVAPAGPGFVVEDSFHRRLQVDGPLDLEVVTGAGHIHLRAGEPGELQVTGTVRGRQAGEEAVLLKEHPPIEQEGNRIRIGPLERSECASRNLSISYDLVVPPETRLRARTGVGEQHVAGILGPVDAVSSSGRLTLEGIGGDVRARTGVGNIRLSEVAGDVAVTTSNGSVDGSGIAGAICARTGVGHVRLRENRAMDLEVTTSSGNVEVSGAQGAVRVQTGVGHIAAEGSPAGEWRLDTGAGNVTVRRPAGAGLELHAHTSSGLIETAGRAAGGRHIRRRIGGGGTPVHVRTGVGNIRIE